MKTFVALALLVLSLPSMAAELVARVPSQFIGRWVSSPAECGSDGDDLGLEIQAGKIFYYESNGPLVAIVTREPREIALIAELSGEGQTWLVAVQFRLSPEEDKLIDDTTLPGKELVRHRCPIDEATLPQ